MSKLCCGSLLIVLLGLTACGGGSAATSTAASSFQPIVAGTQLGNNTSAADSFTGHSNGNAAAGNVSKVSIRKLLSIPASAKIYAHLMVWFGKPNHIKVGYDSADPRQIHKQLDDMESRGIQGAIIDWYGTDPSHSHDDIAAAHIMHDAEERGGFEFAITEDGGGGPQLCARTPGCDVTRQVISDLNYVMRQYAVSPAYMKVKSRPVVFFFGLELYDVNWKKVRAKVKGHPLFVFRNAVGFEYPESNGGFSWEDINRADADDWGQAYLDNFYVTAQQFDRATVVASAYKGFDDAIANWGTDRKVNQRCGQTWLDTLDEVGKYYSQDSRLTGIQLVTWNDYEEGTEIESGIQNCVSVEAGASSSQLKWRIKGNERTIDHYAIYRTIDDDNIERLAEVPAGKRAVELSSLGVNAESGVALYVQAVGKPSIVNHMSGPVKF